MVFAIFNISFNNVPGQSDILIAAVNISPPHDIYSYIISSEKKDLTFYIKENGEVRVKTGENSGSFYVSHQMFYKIK